MSTQLIPFLFESQSVRVVMIDDVPWWVAADVAEILDYRDAFNMTRILDEDEAATHIMRVRSENGVEQDRELTIINESGLYSAIFGSRKPEAKKFKKWVTAEVLPTIRKTGGYSLPGNAKQNPRLIVDLIYAYRAHSLSANAWDQQGLMTGIVALSSYLGLAVPDFSLLGKRVTQMPLFGENAG